MERSTSDVTPKSEVTNHLLYGVRVVSRGDKTLFVGLGERGYGALVQQPDNSIRNTVRFSRDGGSVETVAQGFRNPQGAALRPKTNPLWRDEHGPQGDDELNRIVTDGNYGWPLVNYGFGDPVGDTCRISGGVHAPAYLHSVLYRVPTSIEPADLLFVPRLASRCGAVMHSSERCGVLRSGASAATATPIPVASDYWRSYLSASVMYDKPTTGFCVS